MQRHAQSFDFCNTSAVKRSKNNVLISLEEWSNSKIVGVRNTRTGFDSAFFSVQFIVEEILFHVVVRP